MQDHHQHPRGDCEKFLEAHEGHTENCCCCISVPVGAHILGFLVTLGFFMSIAATAVATSKEKVFLAPMFCLAGLLSACPALSYLLMVHENTTDTRNRFAEAYKSSMKTTGVMLGLSYFVAMFVGTILDFAGEG